MRLLIDTNIILEILLEQAEAITTRRLLSESEIHDFITTDFAIHSIGLLLFRKKKYSIFKEFMNDMLQSSYLIVESLQLTI